MTLRHVLIADDHAVTRRGVRDIVLDLFESAECVEVANGDEAVAALGDRPWDLLLLDVMMPGMPILEVLAQARAKNASVPILVLTASDETQYFVETMKAGANGLIHKQQAASELHEAIRRVAAGGHYLHPDTAVAIAESLRERKPKRLHDDLSEREIEIFRRIALGRSVKEIAFDLGLSDKTVATYLARVRTKTGLVSHVEIARYALRNGLVE